ncbi:hypothetical protein ACUH91_05020 [Dermabacteraceae bacterium P9123]
MSNAIKAMWYHQWVDLKRNRSVLFALLVLPVLANALVFSGMEAEQKTVVGFMLMYVMFDPIVFVSSTLAVDREKGRNVLIRRAGVSNIRYIAAVVSFVVMLLSLVALLFVPLGSFVDLSGYAVFFLPCLLCSVCIGGVLGSLPVSAKAVSALCSVVSIVTVALSLLLGDTTGGHGLGQLFYPVTMIVALTEGPGAVSVLGWASFVGWATILLGAWVWLSGKRRRGA